MKTKIPFFTSFLCICLCTSYLRAEESLLPDEETEVVEGQLHEEDLTVLPLQPPAPSTKEGKFSVFKTFAVVAAFITTATIGLLLSSHNTGKNA